MAPPKNDKASSAGGARGTIANALEVALIEKNVGLYAATSKNNFVTETFAGRAAKMKYNSDITRLYHARPLMIGIPTQCMNCKHLALDGQKFLGVHCKAFPSPDFIPFETWDEGFDHTKPFPGDHGIRFEPIEQPAIVESVRT